MGALPEIAKRWLTDVEHRLDGLPVTQRRELLTNFKVQILHDLKAGFSPEAVLNRLGSAKEISDRVLEEFDRESSVSGGQRYFSYKRLVQAFGAVFALGASIAILLMPLYAVEETNSHGDRVFTAATVLTEMGPVTLMIVAIPVLVASLPLATLGRYWQPASILAAILLFSFALFSSFTIGLYYMPAVILLIAAVFMRPRAI